jgi:hypothetical protein
MLVSAARGDAGTRPIAPAGGTLRVRASRALRAFARRVVALPVAALLPAGASAQEAVTRGAVVQGASGRGALAGPDPRVGYDYVFRISQETGGRRGASRREPAFVARRRHRGSAGARRLPPGHRGSNTPGDWYLTGDGGRTVTLVDERQRTHCLVNVAAVREEVGDGKGLAVRVHDLAAQVHHDGPCGAVAGWATTCVTVDRRYTVRSQYLLMRTETRVAERVRYWVAPALADLTPPFGTFFGSRTELLVRRDSAFVAREREVARALGPGGVLRVEVTHTETNGRARARHTRVIEASELRRAPHDERLFEVPPGYRLVRR